MPYIAARCPTPCVGWLVGAASAGASSGILERWGFQGLAESFRIPAPHADTDAKAFVGAPRNDAPGVGEGGPHDVARQVHGHDVLLTARRGAHGVSPVGGAGTEAALFRNDGASSSVMPVGSALGNVMRDHSVIHAVHV